jgi:hypothetical protein
MPETLPATEGELAAHWNNLQDEMLSHINSSTPKVILKGAAIGEQIIVGFGGSLSKRAQRLRGGPTTVVRFTPVSANWNAWLGYREVWNYLDTKPGRKRFYFSSSDLTLFLEYGDSGDFQQVVRAEWAGLQKDEASGWTFCPSNAGHPHWQVDIAELLKRDTELVAARTLLFDTAPREFGLEEPETTPEPCWYNIGRMHFASGMRPWLDASVAHVPSKLAEVRAWAVGTMGLLRIELGRL